MNEHVAGCSNSTLTGQKVPGARPAVTLSHDILSYVLLSQLLPSHQAIAGRITAPRIPSHTLWAFSGFRFLFY